MQLLKGLKLLELAYNSKDWDKVKESYLLIGGEELIDLNIDQESLEKAKEIYKKSSAKRGRPKKLGNDPVNNRPFNPKNPGNFKADLDPTRLEGNEEPRQPRTSQVRFTGNTFVDDGKLATEDRKIDAKLSKGWKKPESRQPHSYKEVPCDTKGCKEVVNIDPSLFIGETSYYCNGCLSKKR